MFDDIRLWVVRADWSIARGESGTRKVSGIKVLAYWSRDGRNSRDLNGPDHSRQPP